MNTSRTTRRQSITTSKPGCNDYETLLNYGLRCGRYSLRPDPSEPDRWLKNPEFLRGLREGRALRQQPVWPRAYSLILGLPRLRAMRAEIQEVYRGWSEAARRLAASYRAAARSSGRVSSMGRDVGEVMHSRADAAAEQVDELQRQHAALAASYEAERARLMRLRGVGCAA
jgi:hypothetical protein